MQPKLPADRRFHGRDVAVVNVAGGAVQGDVVPFVVRPFAEREDQVFFVYFQFIAAGNAARPHAAGYDGRMGGHAAAGCQDTLRRMHAFNVFRRRFQTGPG
jgi:hypothetical protein